MAYDATSAALLQEVNFWRGECDKLRAERDEAISALPQAVRNERERCKYIAIRHAVMASQMGAREKERTAASIASEIEDAPSTGA